MEVGLGRVGRWGQNSPRETCEGRGELPLLPCAALGSCLPPPPHRLFAAAGQGLKTNNVEDLWRGLQNGRVLFIGRQGLNNGTTAAQWVCGWTSCGTLENVRARPRKRQRRKEGVRQPKGVQPAASSGTIAFTRKR